MRLQPVLVLLCVTAVALDCDAGAPDQDPLTWNFTGQLLQVVPSNANSSLVTELLLDGNRISLNESDRRALGSYPGLVELRLEGNLLTRVPAGFFSVVPNLTRLSLAGNNIHSLDSEAFSGLDLLTDLDLSGNQLTSLPAELHQTLHRLQVLRLQGNPWNCTCLLLSPVREISGANVSIGETPVTCASPLSQAGSEVVKAAARCSSPPPTTSTPTAAPNGTESPGQTHNTTNAGRKPPLGNSWKFTASVAALALVTSGLIVCAVKGPSWYKLFHNYRHRRLHQDDDGDDDPHFVTTVFKKRGSYRTPQTFSFENQDGRVAAAAAVAEEPEDEYFEDPYIKSDGNEGEEIPSDDPQPQKRNCLWRSGLVSTTTSETLEGGVVGASTK